MGTSLTVADKTYKLDEPIQSVSLWPEVLEKQLKGWQSVLPKECRLDPSMLARLALDTLRKNPVLLKCSAQSVLTSIMDAAALGLEIDTKREHGYLVPFKGECIFMPGYRGLSALAMRSGVVHFIEAVIVYEGEEFVHERGLQPVLKHVPSRKHRQIDEATDVYAIARMRGGPDKFEVLDRPYIEKIKQGAIEKAKGRYTCWGDRDREPEMWKKSAVRYVCKLLPDDTLPPHLYEVWKREDAMYPSFDDQAITATDDNATDLRTRMEAAKAKAGAPAAEPASTAPAPAEEPQAEEPEPDEALAKLADKALQNRIEDFDGKVSELLSFGVAEDDKELMVLRRELTAMEAERDRRMKVGAQS